MKTIARQIAVRVLQIANNLVSDKGTLNLPLAWRAKHLDYPVPKAQLSRIFHIHSQVYDDEPQEKGIEIRELAGYGVDSVTQFEHGFGNTRVLRNGTHMNLYINDQKRGVGLKWLNPIIPGKAPQQCEQAFVARTSIMSPQPKQVIFTMQARYNFTDSDDSVILREIFMPVVNDQHKVTGLERIDPKDPDAGIQTLRALIFFKIFTDMMVEKQLPDVRFCLDAVRALPLDKKSTLQDYLMFRPQPKPAAA